ncbi:hypothetical protein Tco_0184127 [Tanacetum coccineum]
MEMEATVRTGITEGTCKLRALVFMRINDSVQTFELHGDLNRRCCFDLVEDGQIRTSMVQRAYAMTWESNQEKMTASIVR